MRRVVACAVLALVVAGALVERRGLPLGAGLLVGAATGFLGFSALGAWDRLRLLHSSGWVRSAPGPEEQDEQQRKMDPGGGDEPVQEQDHPERDAAGGEEGGEASHGARRD